VKSYELRGQAQWSPLIKTEFKMVLHPKIYNPLGSESNTIQIMYLHST
jgi:hypothetical protein